MVKSDLEFVKKRILNLFNVFNCFKIKKKRKKKENEKLRKKISLEISNISRRLKSKKEINFLHSGHLGDIVNSLPFIKENITKKKMQFIYKY